MAWSRGALLLLFSVTLSEGALGESARTRPEEPLPALDERRTGPLGDWAPRAVRIPATRVRLHGLGVRTHANWILFRLPFDARDTDRIREVSFRPHAAVPTAVGAMRVGSVCMAIPDSGSVGYWSLYTVNGIGWTNEFGAHPAPPSDDPTIVGINVPTRVANFVACGGDDRLRDPAQWSLEITWEER